MSRLPQVNGDKGNWGRILNTWLKHIAGFRGVAPARPASGNLPAGVAINGNGYDTSDQFQSENSGLNFHNDFPANVPTGFTFIHTVHNRIYRREGNDWAVLLEGYTPQSGEHLWRRVSTGSPNIRNIPIDGFVGVNTDPDFRLHVLENRNDTIALFEGGSNNDIAEVKIFNSNVRSRSRPGGGIIVGGDALLTFETTNNATWSVGITADYNNDNQRDNFFVISVNNRFGPYNQNDPSDDYLIITPNGAVGIGNNHVPNTNLPTSATLPNNAFYKLDVQGNANVWEQTTTRNFRMWDQNPQFHSLLTAIDTQGNAVWRDFVTLGLVTNAENIPTNLNATNSGEPFAQKVGTVLQFRRIVGETLNHGTLFGVRTDGNLIRVGLTGGNNGDIVWRNQNTGVYEWTNPSSIRNLLGLGTLTVGPLTSSAGVLQVNPNFFNPANNAAQNINIGFTGGSNGQFLTVNNGTYQWASFGTLTLNNTTPTYLSITPNTYNPNNNQTINIGLAGDLTQRGSLVAGPNITLSGNTANRLVGSGDVTITVNIPPGGGGGNTGDQDWLVAINSPTGSPGSVPNNINHWIYTSGRVGIGIADPGNFNYSHNILLHVHSPTNLTQIAASGVFGGQVSAPNFGVTSGGSALPELYGGLSPSNRPTCLISFSNSEGSDRQIILRVNGNNSMTILGEGRVQVGALPSLSSNWIWIDRSRFGVVMDLHRANYATPVNGGLFNGGVFEYGVTVFQGSTSSASNGADFISTIRSRFDSNPNITGYGFTSYFSSARYDHSPRVNSCVAFNSILWCWAPQGVTPPPGYQKSVNAERGMSHVALNRHSNSIGGGYPGVPPITFGSGITSLITGLNIVFDESQRFPNTDYWFIHCYNSREVSGPSDPAGIFVVHGRGHMYLYSADSGGAIAYKNGSLTWVAPSDARLKTNIRPITGALEKIGQLRGVSFDWINQDLHKGDPTSGFLAQEMEKVFPDCVNEVDSPAGDNADSKLTGGKIKTVGLTAGFFATMVEAIKEQQQIIEGLQKTVAQQQQLIDLQNQKIAQLEQKLEELANKRGS